jgi:polyferredoxin
LPFELLISPGHPSLVITFSPSTSAMLADLVLVVHVGIVAFVVLGQLLFGLGGLMHWAWVRRLGIRLAHLLLLTFVTVQSWMGATCPLTVWEQLLRRQAGQTAYGESFIEHWLSRLIFFNAPAWVFVVAYSVFGALVLLTWWWIPPRRFR